MSTAMSNGQVIVIDDEEIVRESMIQTLELEGYQAVAFENPKDALALCSGSWQGVIICDVRMDIMDGLQVLEQVLNSDFALEGEVIAAIATRCSHALDDTSLMHLFLERLANGKAGQAGFSRVLADLMFTPELRLQAFSAFRNPERSEALSAAIGEMFGGRMG